MLSRATFDPFHVKHSRFSDRLGFARWIYHLKRGESPSKSEIARAVDRTGPAVLAWMDLDEAPTDYRVHEPLADFFGVDKEWIISEKGDPPHKELWDAWMAERRSRAVAKRSQGGIPAKNSASDRKHG